MREGHPCGAQVMNVVVPTYTLATWYKVMVPIAEFSYVQELQVVAVAMLANHAVM